MRNRKTQAVVAHRPEIVSFVDALGKRRKALRSTELLSVPYISRRPKRYAPPKLQTVTVTLMLNDTMKQETTVQVSDGKTFIEDTLGKFHTAKVTATIDGKKYLSTTLGKFLAGKR